MIFYVNYDILVKVIKIYSHLLLLRGFYRKGDLKMHQHSKRLITSTFLLTSLLVCLSDPNTCEIAVTAADGIQTTKSTVSIEKK